MTKSMTGYGRKVVEHESEQLIIEIRTVNHRFLDISVHMARELLYLESSIKSVLKTYFERGSVDVYIHHDNRKETQKAVTTDWELLDQYVDQMNKVKSRYHISEAIPFSALLQLPELFTVEEKPLQVEQWEASILSGLHETAKIVMNMRESEGMNLQTSLIKQIKEINDTVQLLQENRSGIIHEYTQRIRTRIKQYVDDFSLVDEGRLQQEIAVLAEKGDITEELTRVESHINHFTEIMHSSGQVGRTLDFITQELHREINTIASKSQDAKMNPQIILMKRNIEKIKEQIQNIE